MERRRIKEIKAAIKTEYSIGSKELICDAFFLCIYNKEIFPEYSRFIGWRNYFHSCKKEKNY